MGRGSCQRYRLSLVFCECLQVIIPKGDMDLAYKISPMYRGSQLTSTIRKPNGPVSAAGTLCQRLSRLASVGAVIATVSTRPLTTRPAGSGRIPVRWARTPTTKGTEHAGENQGSRWSNTGLPHL